MKQRENGNRWSAFAALDRDNTGIYGALWIVNAPGDHLAWDQYAVALYDLTTEGGLRPVIHKPGVTHEFCVFALGRDYPVDGDAEIMGQEYQRLDPPNMGYQFAAESNEAARDRVQAMVDRVVDGKLSLDTDYRAVWNNEFRDGVRLVTSVLDAPAEEEC